MAVLHTEGTACFHPEEHARTVKTDGAVILYLTASCGNTNEKGVLQAFHYRSIKVQEISVFATLFWRKSTMLSVNNFYWQCYCRAANQ